MESNKEICSFIDGSLLLTSNVSLFYGPIYSYDYLVKIRFGMFWVLSWEQRKLSDTFDFLSNNTFSRAELDDEEGDCRDIHYGDVLIKLARILMPRAQFFDSWATIRKHTIFQHSKLHARKYCCIVNKDETVTGK